MRKLTAIICCVFGLCACDKHDPILPGVRTAIFDTASIKVENKTITDLPDAAVAFDNSACIYTQDSANVVWDGSRRIFTGFPTSNTVSAQTRPVCDGKYVYAGLTTGELVKLNPKTRQIIWIADIYRASNLTGGASMVDIIAPIVPHKNFVYAGGLGDAFCKLNATSGDKKWCLDISVGVPFIIAGNYAFVVATDDNLYAIDTTDGAVFWRSSVDNQVVPEYQNGHIRVGDTVYNVADGKKIDKKYWTN